jgi:hypothetical protein
VDLGFCQNRIKELKDDFGLDSFNMDQFWATEAALGMAMLAYYRRQHLRGGDERAAAIGHRSLEVYSCANKNRVT